MNDSEIVQEYFEAVRINYMCKKYCKYCKYYMYNDIEQVCTSLNLTEDNCTIINQFGYLKNGNI